ncbi:MAG: type II secretion system inner membrane protein GspF [Burkholderiales bacterium]|nr:MAG: type II secretion system inner membrane protein GspF [Burkholderiales bacterium]
MPAFRFEAAEPSGRIASGTLDADSARQARAALRERGLTPVRVDAIQEASPVRTLSGRLGTADLALATRQLASLLSARLPLERALSAVVEQAERGVVRERFAAVRSEVVGGHSLAEALSRYPRDFPDVYRALVAAGEQSGDLGLVMSRLADYVESRSALGQKLLMAFTYPAIVTLVAIAVITGLLAYVVPQVVGVFAQTRQQLPLLTTILIAASDFVRAYWWVMTAVAIAAFAGFRVAMRRPGLRLAWHAALLRAPIAGRLIRGLNTARFASTLAILTTSGVPLLRALDAGAQTLGNLAMRENVTDATARVREGVPLSRALSAHGQFPPILIHLIASGEATGELPRMLERAAQAQSQEVERRAFTLTSLLEPLLVLVMGAIVLLIVLAVLLPIIEINQLVR